MGVGIDVSKPTLNTGASEMALSSAEVNRRQFVTLTVAAAAAAAACTCGGEFALAGEAPGPTPKGALEKTPVDVGPKGDYAKDGVIDKFSKSHRVMMVTNGGKIYAFCSTCTHKNCPTKTKDGQEIVCGCHGSKFSVQGTPTKGPAKVALYRLGISVNDKGNIIVDRAKQFDEKHFDDEGSSISAA
jgi:nitrite reductase/ring-hydroxylating ferredoxin subunit